MEGSQRRLLQWLTAFAVLVVLVQAMTGAAELALYATPFLTVVGLLVSGRFIGEDRIVDRWLRSTASPRPRRERARWSGLPERPLASLLERSAHSERGPPAALPA